MRLGLGFLEKKPLPTLREVFFEIKREETGRKVMLKNDSEVKPATGAINDSSAFVSRNESKNDRKKKPWCDHCKKHWHTWENC